MVAAYEVRTGVPPPVPAPSPPMNQAVFNARRCVLRSLACATSGRRAAHIGVPESLRREAAEGGAAHGRKPGNDTKGSQGPHQRICQRRKREQEVAQNKWTCCLLNAHGSVARTDTPGSSSSLQFAPPTRDHSQDTMRTIMLLIAAVAAVLAAAPGAVAYNNVGVRCRLRLLRRNTAAVVCRSVAADMACRLLACARACTSRHMYHLHCVVPG